MTEPDPLPIINKNVSIDISVKFHSWNSVNFNIHKHCKLITEAVIKSVLGCLKNDKIVEVSLLLADDKILNELNKEYRNKDKPTNVLSFPYCENGLEEIKKYFENKNHLFLGDIAISFERLIKESIENGKSFIEYFSHILIHGLLHLFGYDHINDDDAVIMEELEKTIMEQVSLDY